MTIEEICKNYNIRNYTINSDGSIDVSDNVVFNNDFMERIPLKFNKVYGNFTIMHINLNNLDGCPKWIEGNLTLYQCGLNSLKGCTTKVGGDFDCSENNLTDLVGGPESVGGEYWCISNRLTSLKGSPYVIKKSFNCYENGLKTLKGGPESVGGVFNADNNELTDLENIPNCESLKLSGNNISSLKSNKVVVKTDIFLNENFISDIKDFNIDFGGSLFCNSGDFSPLINGRKLDWITSIEKWKIVNGKEIDKKRLEYLYNMYKVDVEDIDYSGEDGYDMLPSDIRDLIDSYYDEDMDSYNNLSELSNILSNNGWYMDYGLDGSIIELRPGNNGFNNLVKKLEKKGFKFV